MKLVVCPYTISKGIFVRFNRKMVSTRFGFDTEINNFFLKSNSFILIQRNLRRGAMRRVGIQTSRTLATEIRQILGVKN